MPVERTRGMSGGLQVLLIDLSKRYGGASVRALTLAFHMQPGVVIAGLENSPVVKIAQDRNIPTRTVGKSRLDPLIPFRLRKIIRQEGFQIIDTQNIQSKFWANLAAVITDVAFVSTLNSAYEEEQGGSFKGKFYATLDRWTNSRTNRYIAVSRPIQNELLKTGIPAEMIDLVTNAVDLEDISRAEEAASTRWLTRKQLGIPGDAFVCSSVGRLVYAKGFEDFIDAFARSSEQMPNLYGLIAGEGSLRPVLSEQIKAAGLESRFQLLGHREPKEVNNILKASDVFVISSRSEGVPFALLEAAAAGLPIVATRCGGIPDVLEDNVDALLVPVGDVRGIASAMMKIGIDRYMAKGLGRKAREKIQRDYSIQKQIEGTERAYRSALANKQSRRSAKAIHTFREVDS